MTEASDPEDPSPPAPDTPTDGAAGAEAARPYLGLTTFTMDGRQAPALFVVGWIATIVGIGLTATVALGASGLAAAVLSLGSLVALAVGLILLAGSQTIERRAAGASYAGPSPLLVLIATYVVTRLIGFLVGAVLLPIADRIPAELGDLIGVALQAVVFFGVIRLLIVGPGVLSWRAMGWSPDRTIAARGLATGATYALPVIVITWVLSAVAISMAGASPPSPLPPTGTASGILLHLLAGAVIAPLAEELLFRGFALTAWRSFTSVQGAILRSSIAFVLAHALFVTGDSFGEAIRIALVAAVVRVPVAFTLGALFARTRSIWVPIGLHAAFNGFLIAFAEIAARSAT